MMENRYLFRGKRLDNGEWVQGGFYQRDYLIERKLVYKYVIQTLDNRGYPMYVYEVDPATIGQCTGLTATKSYRGNEPKDLLIFEDDIIRTKCGLIGVVTWQVNYWKIDLSNSVNNARFVKYDGLGAYLVDIKIIGNVHDLTNPELEP